MMQVEPYTIHTQDHCIGMMQVEPYTVHTQDHCFFWKTFIDQHFTPQV